MAEVRKRVAVLGAGPVGRATAAYLAHHGHDVGIWSPSGRGTAPLMARAGDPGKGVIEYRGALEGRVEVDVLRSPDALAAYEVIVVAFPGHAYDRVLPLVLPRIESRHIVIVSGALSLVPLWLYEQAGNGTARPLVASWGTTLATARRSERADVEIGSVRARFDVAAIPAAAADAALACCQGLFGDRFDLAPSILATAISSVNPVAHAAEALPNLTRMERGEDWYLFECMTPAAARLAEAIDAERLEIAQALGLKVRSLATHYQLSYHVPLATVAEMAAAIHARDRAPLGPRTAEHRYVLEDMPQEPVGLDFTCATAAICAQG